MQSDFLFLDTKSGLYLTYKVKIYSWNLKTSDHIAHVHKIDQKGIRQYRKTHAFTQQ